MNLKQFASLVSGLTLTAAVYKGEKSDQSHVNSGASNKTLENLTQHVGVQTTADYTNCIAGLLDVRAKSCLCSSTLGNKCDYDFCCVEPTGCVLCPSKIQSSARDNKNCPNTGGYKCGPAPPPPPPPAQARRRRRMWLR
jgi:hypothetical protein